MIIHAGTLAVCFEHLSIPQVELEIHRHLLDKDTADLLHVDILGAYLFSGLRTLTLQSSPVLH